MDFDQAMDYLYVLSKNGYILGLDNIKKLMVSLGRPDKSIKFIHVGGTNGKGSTCVYISNILDEAGFKVGLYTSPHIFNYNERFSINGKSITDEEIAEILSDIRLISQGEDISLTSYEAEIALAVLYFVKNGCDFAILEIGLGGRRDASNFIDSPELGVLTQIGMDHTDVLGPSLDHIAMEKSAIIKEGSDYISYYQRGQVREILDEKAREENARISYLSQDDIVIKESKLLGQTFDYKDYKDIGISMLGSHQVYNASLAILAIEKLRGKGHIIEDESIYRGLKNSKIPARLQIVNKNPLVILDGAHNPDGVQGLVNSLDEYLPNKKYYFVYGSLKDKDYEKIIDISSPYAKKYFTYMTRSERTLSSFDLKRTIISKSADAVACGSVKLALSLALNECGPSDCIICFGSLYNVGEILTYFKMEN